MHHPSRFAFCAYPSAYDWRHRKTHIINEEGAIYSVDNGGMPITEWPTEWDLAENFDVADLPLR